MMTPQEERNQFLLDLADFLERCYLPGLEGLTLQREFDPCVVNNVDNVRLTLCGPAECELVVWNDFDDISVGFGFGHMHLYSPYRTPPEVMRSTIDAVFDILRGVRVSYAVYRQGECSGGGLAASGEVGLERLAASSAASIVPRTIDEVHVQAWGQPVVIERRPPSAA
ncbi:hypothetical protein L6R49_26155 [Myxococcota bacterium]|nr:hypothetical protein [Myxococcota bacterium]